MKLTYALLRKQRTHNLRYVVRTLLMKLAPELLLHDDIRKASRPRLFLSLMVLFAKMVRANCGEVRQVTTEAILLTYIQCSSFYLVLENGNLNVLVVFLVRFWLESDKICNIYKRSRTFFIACSIARCLNTRSSGLGTRQMSMV